MPTPAKRNIIRDTSGASIVIALVFFLICAIIGSVVLTAASVNAKAVQTHRELQQAEFTVGSAAQTIGCELESARITCVANPAERPIVEYPIMEFARDFWDQNGSAVMMAHAAGQSIAFGDSPDTRMTLEVKDGSRVVDTVYASMTIDPDLNIVVRLSLERSFAPDSPYNMTVSLQCIPTYNLSGRLVSFSYEPAVIAKAEVLS